MRSVLIPADVLATTHHGYDFCAAISRDNIYTKKTCLIFLITVTFGLINLALTYYFVKFYGIMDGSLSLFLVNFFSYLIAWYIGNRVFPIRWFHLKW